MLELLACSLCWLLRLQREGNNNFGPSADSAFYADAAAVHKDELTRIIQSESEPAHLTGIVRVYLVKFFKYLREFLRAEYRSRYRQPK